MSDWLRGDAVPFGTAEPIRNSLRPASNFGKIKKRETAGKCYCCGGLEEPKGGDGDAAATVAHAVKGCNGEEKGDVDAASAFSP